MRRESLPLNHPDLAASYNNIDVVYRNMGDYSKALSNHEKALEIQRQSFPQNHSDLIKSYVSIGLLHENMGEYLKANSFYNFAVNIGQQLLPVNHFILEILKNSMARIKKML